VARTTEVLIALLLAMACPPSYGHGGVAIEDDVCIIRIDRYKAHFTGYIPQQRATQEFCEDIPVVGNSVFVLDFISDELRDMQVDFRIVRDINNLGLNVTADDLGDQDAISQSTIHYAGPQYYSNGVLTTRYRFTTGGGYIGIVTALHPEAGERYQAIFPFRVGELNYTRYLLYYVLLFGFCGIVIYMTGRNRFFAFEE